MAIGLLRELDGDFFWEAHRDEYWEMIDEILRGWMIRQSSCGGNGFRVKYLICTYTAEEGIVYMCPSFMQAWFLPTAALTVSRHLP